MGLLHTQWTAPTMGKRGATVRSREWMGEVAHPEIGHFACIPVTDIWVASRLIFEDFSETFDFADIPPTNVAVRCHR